MKSFFGRFFLGLLSVWLVLATPTLAETFSLGSPVSPAGDILAEFSSSTAPGNPLLMAASAIKRIGSGELNDITTVSVYVSRNGGSTWSEVPAWPAEGLQPQFDPQVFIDDNGVIHASAKGETADGARILYTQSRDQGRSWSPARVVTPFPSSFPLKSEDKDNLTVAADGTIYIVFNEILTQPEDPRGLIVARSTDAGRTWITRDTGGAGFPNGIVTGPGGSVTVTFVAGVLPGYGTVTSTDGGDTWYTAVNLGDINLSQGLQLPSIVRYPRNRVVIANLAGPNKPIIEISVERLNGTLERQWRLPLPQSNACRVGRRIQPALAGSRDRPPAFQFACKIDPTKTTPGEMEVWLYPNVDKQDQEPVLVTRFTLPPGVPNDTFAEVYPDGGDYWSFTFGPAGWLSMWIDPSLEAGPGQLRAAPVTPIN